MSDTDSAMVSSREEQLPLGFRGPPLIGPSGKSGAFIVEGDEAERTIRQWLKRYGVNALAYSASQFDEFVQHIAERRFMWIVVESSGYALKSPWFDGLFRVAIETDTEIWTASDNTEFGMHLFCSMLANWEFLAPYVPESNEATSLTSLRDALARIEERIQKTISDSKGNDLGDCANRLAEREVRQVASNGLRIDLDQGTLAYREGLWFLGNTIVLRLAERLGRCPAKWFSFDELREDVWCDPATDEATIGRTIRLLRSKLKKEHITSITIENSRSMKLHARLLLT